MPDKFKPETIERAKAEILALERRFAYEQTGAASARRSKVRELIDTLVGELESQ